MTQQSATLDSVSDPFGESGTVVARKRMQLLGGRFEFESNNGQLLRLVESAYGDLPPHRLSRVSPTLRIKLVLGTTGRSRRRFGPPPLAMLSGAGFIGGATDSSNLVIVSPGERSALVVVSPDMVRFAYHARYEMIEFAVFTLAARAQGLVALHAACVSRGRRGVLLMGPSGSGKSTVALQCLLKGFEFLAEDGVFVAPHTMRATGVANFLHVRSDSVGWIERARDAAVIRKSPIIRRRSGVQKYEINLRRPEYRLAAQPPSIRAVIFLSSQSAGRRPLLRLLPKSDLSRKLAAEQAYAANQPEWDVFVRNVSRLNVFELRRGRHPREAAEVLETLIGSLPPAA